MITILFLAADPTDASRLRLGEELREIQERLQLSKARDLFALHERMAVRPADISQALLDLDPQIVHFSGHGTSSGALCIEDRVGETHPVEPEALASLFEQFADEVECVVLNACYSVRQAQAIARHIRYVIGMNQPIGDRAAIAFSVGFYQALGAGRSVEEAYELGRVQIRLENIPEHLVPALIKADILQPPDGLPSTEHPTVEPRVAEVESRDTPASVRWFWYVSLPKLKMLEEQTDISAYSTDAIPSFSIADHLDSFEKRVRSRMSTRASDTISSSIAVRLDSLERKIRSSQLVPMADSVTGQRPLFFEFLGYATKYIQGGFRRKKRNDEPGEDFHPAGAFVMVGFQGRTAVVLIGNAKNMYGRDAQEMPVSTISQTPMIILHTISEDEAENRRQWSGWNERSVSLAVKGVFRRCDPHSFVRARAVAIFSAKIPLRPTVEDREELRTFEEHFIMDKALAEADQVIVGSPVFVEQLADW